MSTDAVMVRTIDMTHRDWLRLSERRFQVRRAWAHSSRTGRCGCVR
jgi:hypothetical protein